MANTNTVPLLINGQDIHRETTFEVISPGTGEVCWKAVSASADDAAKAVESAQAAFPSWSQTKPSTRSAILLKAAEILEKNIEKYADYMMAEMGADKDAAQFFVTPLAIAMCRDIAGRISSVCGSIPVVAKEGQSAMVWKEPYGVVLGVVAWNAPYVFGIRSAATAIATGNTTVIKSSEVTPRCYYELGRAFKEAGLPDGVFNVVACRPEDAPAVVNTMIGHPAVRKVDFTGSAATGRKIARTCADHLKPILMELGGKNTAIVLEDADLEKAADECLAGAFLNAGQICMGTDRIAVHTSIAPAFTQVLQQRLEAFSKSAPGPPTVSSSASKERLARLVTSALSSGARLIAGPPAQPPSPATFLPTILADVPPSTTLYHEEAFGPLVSLSTFSTDAEAIAFANSTPYGLHGAIFSRDLRRALGIAKKLEVGAVHINSMTVHDEPALPMGGFLVRKVVTWDD
ncbi:aldehyde dehydrogenase family protein [Karstenula rhodostoma CBS 690.94]|uniref:Aldehyde dehydrogenase family protein n=1 Tax=Karstenula rhodostoma CBS 690.94 TaxID=1392251 RepID=A0A9P4Q0B1_9PLEO|nr:aldehyde dehydrogenase family protein [Karstenula rhodostoma CBS 690.94]